MGEFHLTIEAGGVDVAVTCEDGYNPTVVDDLAVRLPSIVAVTYREILQAQREFGVLIVADSEDSDD